jgi:hypothetical protein
MTRHTCILCRLRRSAFRNAHGPNSCGATALSVSCMPAIHMWLVVWHNDSRSTWQSADAGLKTSAMLVLA